MMIVAITRILNEADIVEAFTRHAAALVDHHIFLDNGSTDATLNILSALSAEGLSLEVHRSDAVVFAERDQNNFLFRHAVKQHRADWVMPLDTDEFLDLRDPADLRAVLSITVTDALNVPVREYVASHSDDTADLLIPSRIRNARAPSKENMKVIARGSLAHRAADLQPGGHSIKVDGCDVSAPVFPGAVHAHYSVRSPWQWIAKFTMGWSKVLAAGPAVVAAGTSIHYREPFNVMASNPAHILRSPYFMEFRHDEPDLTCDPIRYLGAPLRYTAPVDYEMRAFQALTTYLERLSRCHGELREAAVASTSSTL